MLNGFLPSGGPGDPEVPKDDKTERWLALRKKYGDNELKGRMEWIDWAKTKMPLGDTPAAMAKKYASQYKLNPGVVLSSAMEEGIGARFPKKDGSLSDISEAYLNANQKGELKGYDVDGFLNYGLDSIGDKFPELVKGGYLPKDFEKKFKPYKAKNERGELMTTAAFKDDESAMMAKTAILAAERDRIQNYAQSKKITLTPEEQDFFTLASYNGGYGNGQKMLDYYSAKGLVGNNGFLKHKMAEKGQIYDNIMPRLAGSRLFNGEKFFDDPPPQTAMTAPLSGL